MTIPRSTMKFRVRYIGKGIYQCSFEYQMREDGQIETFKVLGVSHNDCINKALEYYKEMTLIGL